MIKFFRKIRQNLLSEGKTSKYFKYAIGEIILVVIGILIALQINNWNENQKAKKLEQVVLKNLAQENKANLVSLNQLMTTVSNCYDANHVLMELFNKDDAFLSTQNIDSLLFNSLEFDRFSPSENVLQELLSSGKLDIIESDALKNSLFDWTRVLKIAEERYLDCNRKLVSDLTPYLTQNYVFKDLDQYGNLNWKEPSKFKKNKHAVFGDLVYENLIDDFMYRIDRYLTQLKELETIIKKIELHTND
jgi:hypothetical protein|tara:strand:+ start:148 stop:888 length:741 start_codon:yes stop_codon:yes gene_type:complete